MVHGDAMPDSGNRDAFLTTRWSLVDGAAAEGGASLEALCRQYWSPVYAVVRRSGHDVEAAKDLTQGFFADLLAKGWLGGADRKKGRFRTFLITALKRYLVNEWHHDHAAKRGGFSELVPLDIARAERLSAVESGTPGTPDALFDRRWALALLDAALARLEHEYDAAGRAADFAVLKPCLTAERGSIDYPEVAVALQKAEGAARVAVHRLRKRYRQVFRDEVARTVGDEADVDAEMAELLAALSGRPV